MNKNDIAMEAVFNTVDILDGVKASRWFDITAQELKEISGREPRLLAKIDTSSSNPQVMKEHGVSMLAIKNGEYRFSTEDPFIKIPDLSGKRIFPLKEMSGLLSYDLFSNKRLTEMQVLGKAFNNNILTDCFGEIVVHAPIGRRRGTFDLRIGKTPFPVEGVQIEIDGCYESATTVHVVEAKISGQKDAALRQLVYPKRMLESEFLGKKKVKVWLLTFDRRTGVYDLHNFVDKGHHFYFDESKSKRYILK